ncbi:hypothetical protein FSP39_017886 [Pinctada imbricata]|uniref:Uncharacterized protein n=1 Tax=Pinctada imbricata TaxID=66713 RepID=A0AA88XMW0_PINIB|nr:hypothetical protein FSP39_017886 [Pinctada imbricata]
MFERTETLGHFILSMSLFQDNVREEDVRREVFGPPLNELVVSHIDTSVSRPTTASSRRSVLWSRERKAYEEKSEKRMLEFRTENYMQKKYPEIRRHWPGTWRTVNSRELDKIVDRLSRPTIISSNRAKSAPLLHRRVRTPQTHQWCKYYCINRCKQEHYVPWAPSPISDSSWPQSVTRDVYSSYSNHSENRLS